MNESRKMQNKNNTFLSGYPLTVCSHRELPIKINDAKTIIWAPHHTIESKVGNYFSTFKNYCDFFVNLQTKYMRSIKIIFRPHPALFDKLCQDPEWGKVRAIQYYQFWNENNLISSGDYQILFNESDAMILDSVSFLAEYLFTQKPYCFLTRYEKPNYENKLNDFGRRILSSVYIAANKNEIIDFIEEVVIKEKDKLYTKRRKLIDEINSELSIPCANQAIFDHLRKELT
jgi:CDP-glycerol glycerophosphotransferase (TagB/SpsB family)